MKALKSVIHVAFLIAVALWIWATLQAWSDVDWDKGLSLLGVLCYAALKCIDELMEDIL